VLTPPTELPTRGVLAVVADREGALFALVTTRDGDPPEQLEPAHNRWLWNELWTGDVDRAADFYQSVAGYSVEEPRNVQTAQDYRVLRADGRPRAGIMDNPFGEQPPVWVNYLRVESPAAVTARVEQLGGRVIVEAAARPAGGEAAFIAGPSGAGIALQTWPLNQP
jgi:predicted enzyme related to lactoylglutathione lyase